MSKILTCWKYLKRQVNYATLKLFRLKYGGDKLELFVAHTDSYALLVDIDYARKDAILCLPLGSFDQEVVILSKEDAT